MRAGFTAVGRKRGGKSVGIAMGMFRYVEKRVFFESPESLRSRASHGSRRSPFERLAVSLRSTARSLRASLTAFAAVLASAVFPKRLAPFSPSRPQWLGQSMGRD
jgi:hypothetical protein